VKILRSEFVSIFIIYRHTKPQVCGVSGSVGMTINTENEM